MKKTLYLFLLLIGTCASLTKAQSLIENFDNITTLPGTGWILQNNSQPVGSTNWFQGNSAVFPAFNGTSAAYIGTNFNNTTGNNTISNWLISPNRTFHNGDRILFYTRTVPIPTFPDRLQVRLSTDGTSADVGTTATSVGSFTSLLLDINPTLTANGYPNSWTQYTITLSSLPPQGVSGRFAFRYFVTSGGPSGANSDYIGIDNVVYEGNAVPCSPFVATQTTPDGLAVQVIGGVQYERLKAVDRINGYEIRQTEQNATGYFLLTQPGPYSITVIGANGCRATVTGTF